MKEDKELRDRFLEEFSYHHGHYKHKINYKTQGGDIVEFWEDCVPKEVLDFIESEKEKSYEEGVIKGRLEALPITKKLLSERTFTKKELEIIDWYLTEYETQEGVDKEADRLRKKVSELLKKKQ